MTDLPGKSFALGDYVVCQMREDNGTPMDGGRFAGWIIELPLSRDHFHRIRGVDGNKYLFHPYEMTKVDPADG